MTLVELEAAAVYRQSEAGSPGLPLPMGSAGQVRALLVIIVTANEPAGGGEPGGRRSGPSFALGPPDPDPGAGGAASQRDGRLRAPGSAV